MRSQYRTRVELAAVAALGKTTATVSKAHDRVSKRWREQMRDKLERKKSPLPPRRYREARQRGGMSPEVEEKIRAALMEIKL